MLVAAIDDIELRLLEPRHAAALAALTEPNLDHLSEWLPWAMAWSGPDDTRKFLKAALAQFGRNQGFQAGIWRDGQTLVGVVGLHAVSWANQRTSVGYWLGQSHTGEGIMTRAVAGLVGYIFADMGLNRVEIRCAPSNRKSRGIPERLGFVEEGRIRDAERIGDRWVDHVVYGMLAEDWSWAWKVQLFQWFVGLFGRDMARLVGRFVAEPARANRSRVGGLRPGGLR